MAQHILVNVLQTGTVQAPESRTKVRVQATWNPALHGNSQVLPHELPAKGSHPRGDRQVDVEILNPFDGPSLFPNGNRPRSSFHKRTTRRQDQTLPDLDIRFNRVILPRQKNGVIINKILACQCLYARNGRPDNAGIAPKTLLACQ